MWDRDRLLPLWWFLGGGDAGAMVTKSGSVPYACSCADGDDVVSRAKGQGQVGVGLTEGGVGDRGRDQGLLPPSVFLLVDPGSVLFSICAASCST